MALRYFVFIPKFGAHKVDPKLVKTDSTKAEAVDKTSVTINSCRANRNNTRRTDLKKSSLLVTQNELNKKAKAGRAECPVCKKSFVDGYIKTHVHTYNKLLFYIFYTQQKRVNLKMFLDVAT